ncbi:protein ecdysoneless isoform X1 [Euwallacea fornicatus]|uniref:protein ecdysoneless isoform X1 n=1 Tax=Euwallacea fornicatus TaxID=995702 RepID=UPI00338FEC29
MDKLNNILQTIREDDFVEYYLFPRISAPDESRQQEVLDSALAVANQVVKQQCQDYLWHKDPFKLTTRTHLSNFLTHIDGKEEELPPHLYGVSHYGDNIEDEWFIVFLLREITKQIPGLIARVYDSDGEFLLIEAADYLPQWASPDTCENRVYIYEGNIHLLPPKDLENPIVSVEEALQQIWSSPVTAPIDIQNCILNRISNFPHKIKDTQHFATVYVPTAVAAILQSQPSFISAAVQAFINRDTVDMKACRAMKYFPPEQRVKTRVKFTKCLYAMLLHSKYVPEKKIGWNLPAVGTDEYRQHLLGVKVACGFEILAAQAKPPQDIEGDRGWMQYLTSLKDKGYFSGLLEGSQKYNSRFNKAKEYYTEHKDTMHYSPALGRDILHLLRTCEINFEKLQLESENLAPDDDDSWLDMSPEELDNMLQERYGQKKVIKLNQSTGASNFAEKVNKFLTHVSDIEGAEFPCHNDIATPPYKPPRPKKGVSFAQDANKNESKVKFDPDSFASAIHNMLNFVIPEDDSWDLESDSDMSEYEDDNVAEDNLNDTGKTGKMQRYMEEMDAELSSTTMGQSFEKKKDDARGFEDIESFQPVDIDMNALKNILESYKAQMGDAGPSSNMLGPMGVHLDPKQ